MMFAVAAARGDDVVPAHSDEPLAKADVRRGYLHLRKWILINPGRQKLHAALLEHRFDVVPAKLLPRGGAGHAPARAVTGTIERIRAAFPAHDETRRRHRTWNHAQDTRARWRCPFAMHDQFAPAVHFLPREVVMILHAGDHLCADRARRTPGWQDRGCRAPRRSHRACCRRTGRCG